MQSQFLISAAHKSSGKTVVSVGLAAWLSSQGKIVQSFKKGPDYIDSMWLARATGRACYNLDYNTQSLNEINNCLTRYSQNTEIIIIEGNKGLYDGIDVAGSDCSAALATALGLPVVLVIDCQGITRGVAPLLVGYQQFATNFDIAGVILNKVANNRHQLKLITALETYTDLPVLGVLHRNIKLAIKERHIGLIPSNEHKSASAWLKNAGRLIGAEIDTAKLLQLTSRTQRKTGPKISKYRGEKKIQLGIARDAVFGFYYVDDLERFEQNGVELIFFDTLKDQVLPKIDALFIGGGFPERHLSALQNNRAMCDSIKMFVEKGGVAYLECGGLMYFCRTIIWRGKRGKMCGVFNADVELQSEPIGRGCVQIKPTTAHPWGLQPTTTLHAHEFHYSKLSKLDFVPEYAYKVIRGHGIDGQCDGLVYKNVLAMYAHQRNTESNRWVDLFVDFIRQKKA